MKQRYASRISPALILILAAVFVPTTYLMVREGSTAGLVINLATVVFIAVLFAGIRYEIREGTLYVHGSFLVKLRIPIREIRSIRRSYNPLASPAGSLRRLAVRYGENGMTLISPRDEAGFIQNLRALNPQIEVEL